MIKQTRIKPNFEKKYLRLLRLYKYITTNRKEGIRVVMILIKPNSRIMLIITPKKPMEPVMKQIIRTR
jgi:hypothetical protein